MARFLRCFLVVMFVFRSAIADWNHVPSGSMIPSIIEGDRIVVNKLAYGLRVSFTLTWIARWGEPKRSEVVTFESPISDTLLVKRVIGLPGDEISLSNNQLLVNGEAAEYQPIETEGLSDAIVERAYGHEIFLETVLDQSRTVMKASYDRLRERIDPNRSFAPITVP